MKYILALVMALLLWGCGSSGGVNDAGVGDGDAYPVTDRADPGEPGAEDGDGGYDYEDDGRDGGEGGEDRDLAPVGGWITVLEVNQAWLDAPWEWYGGLRAYFTTALHYTQSLTWHTPRFLVEVAREGNCTLYSFDMRLLLPPCEPPCDPDQECIEDGDQWVCVDLAEHFNVGVITVEGLKADATLIADEWDRYLAEGLPADLFDDGDVVTVSTSGGDLEPFTLQAGGVAHLEIPSNTLALARDQAAVVSWTPADPDSRVLVSLLMGHHWPSIPWVALLCDAPDGDGRVDISAALVNGFIDRAFMGGHPSQVIRYSREVIEPFGKEIELIVGSMRDLQLTLP